MSVTDPAPPWPDDPQAPYFEHLYVTARHLRPGITRAETLAALRQADPADTLRITAPLDPAPDPAPDPDPADRPRRLNPSACAGCRCCPQGACEPGAPLGPGICGDDCPCHPDDWMEDE